MANKLSSHPIHLGLGATAIAQPEFTDMSWYAEYGQRNAQDGKEGRLMSMYSFAESWSEWEMHPSGAEVVICTAGKMTLLQEIDGATQKTELNPGEYAINPPGVWHTVDLTEPATAIFVTAGMGTQHRRR